MVVEENDEVEVGVVNGVDEIDEVVVLVERVVENEDLWVTEVLMLLGEVEMIRKPATSTIHIIPIAIANLDAYELLDIEPLNLGEIRF